MTAKKIAALLQSVPFHLVGEAGLAPAEAGFYAWWCIPNAIPGVLATAHPSEPYELLYVGVAPDGPDSQSNIRNRLRNHTHSNVGSSTFRFDLAALLHKRKALEARLDGPAVSD